jgi:hypothetical protein
MSKHKVEVDDQKISLQDAEYAYKEEKSWFCASCDTIIEYDSTKPYEQYCRECRDYWNDVEMGYFEENQRDIWYDES